VQTALAEDWRAKKRLQNGRGIFTLKPQKWWKPHASLALSLTLREQRQALPSLSSIADSLSATRSSRKWAKQRWMRKSS